LSAFEVNQKFLSAGIARLSESREQRCNQVDAASMRVTLELPSASTELTLQDIRALKRLMAQAEHHIAYRQEQLLRSRNLCLDFDAGA